MQSFTKFLISLRPVVSYDVSQTVSDRPEPWSESVNISFTHHVINVIYSVEHLPGWNQFFFSFFLPLVHYTNNQQICLAQATLVKILSTTTVTTPKKRKTGKAKAANIFPTLLFLITLLWHICNSFDDSKSKDGKSWLHLPYLSSWSNGSMIFLLFKF